MCATCEHHYLCQFCLNTADFLYMQYCKLSCFLTNSLDCKLFMYRINTQHVCVCIRVCFIFSCFSTDCSWICLDFIFYPVSLCLCSLTQCSDSNSEYPRTMEFIVYRTDVSNEVDSGCNSKEVLFCSPLWWSCIKLYALCGCVRPARACSASSAATF